MKKGIVKVFACLMAAASLSAFAACEKEPNAEQKKLYISGSLQTLYGGEEGYPQAVIVGKKSFTAAYPAYTNSLLEKLANAETYLSAAQPSAIISALSSKLTEGETPAFNAKNLTAEVVKNCNVKFVAAQQEKENVRSVLSGMMGQNAPSVAEEFFYTPSSAETDVSAPSSVCIYSPDGAPALALVQLISEDSETISCSVVNASAIQTYVTNKDEENNADFCIMPVNLAAKLLGSGEKYQMLGTITHGNLFILSNDSAANFNEAESLRALIGKEVGVVNLPNVPGMVFKMILKKYDIPFAVVENDGELAADKVNLRALSGAQDVTAESAYAAFVVAEPLASLRTK